MSLMPSATSDKATAFIDSVVRLQPQLAVFDCDGTLWSGDSGESFFYWELNRGLVSEETARWARQRYADYKAGKVSEDDMCGEMVTMHRGLYETDVRRAALEYFDVHMLGDIFADMRELVSRLRRQRCDVWAVSSTNQWVIRAAMRHFDIPEDHIIAAYVDVEKGRITDRLLRVPSGEGKPREIRKMVGKIPEMAFGNSRWDIAMLEMVPRPFAINPNPDLAQLARERNWTIYLPQAVTERSAAAESTL